MRFTSLEPNCHFCYYHNFMLLFKEPLFFAYLKSSFKTVYFDSFRQSRVAEIKSLREETWTTLLKDWWSSTHLQLRTKWCLQNTSISMVAHACHRKNLFLGFFWKKNNKKTTSCLIWRACLFRGQLCPSPHTFLARQGHLSHLSQQSYAQRKEKTVDHRLKTLGLQLFSFTSPLLKSDKKSLHEITVNSQC